MTTPNEIVPTTDSFFLLLVLVLFLALLPAPDWPACQRFPHPVNDKHKSFVHGFSTKNRDHSLRNRHPYMNQSRIHSFFAPYFLVLGLTAIFAHPATGADLPTSDTGKDGDGEYQIGPDYKIDPALADQGNPKGKSFEFSMPLADSKIFRGDDPTLQPEKKPVRKERMIYVYVPAGYQDGAKAPVLIIHDGPGQLNLVLNALDNLTISKEPNRRLPAFIAIAVQNGGNDGKNSQRGLEYDTMSDRLARFIHGEVLPAVLNNAEIKAAYPNVALTDNPWARAVMGCSSGGAAALTMRWFRPDLFRRVLAYSGTFAAQQDAD